MKVTKCVLSFYIVLNSIIIVIFSVATVIREGIGSLPYFLMPAIGMTIIFGIFLTLFTMICDVMLGD